jgi:hypothetical protein
MWMSAGRKNVPAHAHTRRASLRTRAAHVGTRESAATSVKVRYFESGMEVARRMRSEMGREGVVTSTEGIASRRVRVLRTAITGWRRNGDGSCI